MSKVKGPVFGSTVKGQLGHIVTFNRSGRAVKYSYPRRPLTEAQLLHQDKLRFFGAKWHTIDQDPYIQGAKGKLITPYTLYIQTMAGQGWPMTPYGFDHQVNIPISIYAGGSISDYQMMLTVYKGPGANTPGTIYCNNHCVNWPFDIRFIDSNQDYKYYWLEKYTSEVAVFWIKLDVPSTEREDYYMLYGKGGLSDEGDGDNTFLLFDHFIGDALELSKWLPRLYYDGEITVSDSKVRIHPPIISHYASQLNSVNTYGASNILLQARCRYENTFGGESRYQGIGFGNLGGQVRFRWRGTDGYHLESNQWSSQYIWELLTSTSGPSAISYPSTYPPANTWFDMKFYYLDDGTIGTIINDTSPETVVDDTWLSAQKKAGFSSGFFSNMGGDNVIDYTFIRKYLIPQPTWHQPGIEE